jgi:hypothetical protein
VYLFVVVKACRSVTSNVSHAKHTGSFGAKALGKPYCCPVTSMASRRFPGRSEAKRSCSGDSGLELKPRLNLSQAWSPKIKF